jgi:hypothetical protein
MTEVGAGSDGKTTYLLGAGSQTNTNEAVGIPTSASRQSHKISPFSPQSDKQ